MFASVAGEVRSRAVEANPKSEELLRRIDRRGRMVLGLFKRQEEITANDVARILGLSPRQVRDLLAGWVEAGWLVIGDPARKSRRYRLSAEYRWSRSSGVAGACSNAAMQFCNTIAKLHGARRFLGHVRWMSSSGKKASLPLTSVF